MLPAMMVSVAEAKMTPSDNSFETVTMDYLSLTMGLSMIFSLSEIQKYK